MEIDSGEAFSGGGQGFLKENGEYIGVVKSIKKMLLMEEDKEEGKKLPFNPLSGVDYWFEINHEDGRTLICNTWVMHKALKTLLNTLPDRKLEGKKVRYKKGGRGIYEISLVQ